MKNQDYESDVERLLRELIERNPSIEESQREGRAIFWDKQVDFESQHREAADEVPPHPYPYDWYSPLPHPHTQGHHDGAHHR